MFRIKRRHGYAGPQSPRGAGETDKSSRAFTNKGFQNTTGA